MVSGTTQKRKILFVMTVDTEEEWNWNNGFPVAQYGVRNIQNVPKFQKFCDDLGVKPTYFIDYPIVSDPTSVQCFKTLAETGNCEIGAHLHTWVTPPLEEAIDDEHTHAVNLPPDLVRYKIKNLTHKLHETFGQRPLTFRSGRWGINGQLLRMLAEEGYQTDSSVFPFYADSTFSYYNAPATPYWPDWTDCIERGTQRKIFEIPVTSGFNLPYFTTAHNIHSWLSGPPWKVVHAVGILWHLHVIRKLQLSPELADAANMIRLVDACLKRGHEIIHMFLHSSSLLPGGTEYVTNQDDEKLFYQNMADVIMYLKANTDVQFCTLTEAKQNYL